MTITAKIKINPTIEQQSLLQNTVRAYQKGCNFVSSLVFQMKELAQRKLHKMTYEVLRNEYSLRSQMAQSVMKTVIARYKSAKSNGHEWKQVQFKKPEYDLVWNRDYSLTKDFFSINTLEGRINFVATTYDSQGKSLFFTGRAIKDKRSHYKHLRKQLQQKQTSSARRRLQAIGQRETRWQADVNHTVSKALVTRYGANTLFVIEDLSGVRQATERVRVQDRYQTVSWAFYQLRQMLEYKALLHGSKVIAVDPKYTSQTCPTCGHTNRANRNKIKHTFCCKNCSYQSNDDRIGAINLQRKGIEYIVEVTA